MPTDSAWAAEVTELRYLLEAARAQREAAETERGRLREALARIVAEPDRAAGIAWDALHHQ